MEISRAEEVIPSTCESNECEPGTCEVDWKVLLTFEQPEPALTVPLDGESHAGVKVSKARLLPKSNVPWKAEPFRPPGDGYFGP
jgi:hypothetical protein